MTLSTRKCLVGVWFERQGLRNGGLEEIPRETEVVYKTGFLVGGFICAFLIVVF